MELRKYRWSRDYESAEEELVGLIAARGLAAQRWHAEGDHVFEPHVHDYDKKLWCVEGSIIFTIGSKTFSLQAGDAFDIPAQTMHQATVGFMGTVCYEAQVK